MVVKIMVLFLVLNIIRQLVFRGPKISKGDYNFDNHPYVQGAFVYNGKSEGSSPGSQDFKMLVS